jgi:hypothetical protein
MRTLQVECALSEVEVDILIRNNTHILVEVKANVSSGNVVEFWRKGNLYQKATGIKPRPV